MDGSRWIRHESHFLIWHFYLNFITKSMYIDPFFTFNKHWGKHEISFFFFHTWKITRNFMLGSTLLRWRIYIKLCLNTSYVKRFYNRMAGLENFTFFSSFLAINSFFLLYLFLWKMRMRHECIRMLNIFTYRYLCENILRS